jgi:CRISPR/Cas system-associated exonuclease Cas4 (RecB family)
MLQIIPKISLLNAEKEFEQAIKGITLRGYINKPPVSVTGGIKWAIEKGEIKPLSVGDITNIFCPTRRDIYLKRIQKIKDAKNWGKVTGILVESCLCGFTNKYKDSNSINRIKTYEGICRETTLFMDQFYKNKKKAVGELARFKSRPDEDENWLLCQLNYALRHELVMLRATKKLSDKNRRSEVIQHMEIKPNEKILGITSPSVPDFVIPGFSAIGDIKTGWEFKDYFRLAAAGYALAYENQKGAGNDINLGLIYYFPTKKRDVSFAHLYMFVIDDTLRQEFLDRRDDALLVIKKAKDNPPTAPILVDREKHCVHCKYISECDKSRRE